MSAALAILGVCRRYSSAPFARDVAARFVWWSRRFPERGLVWLVRQAEDEARAAIHAQARRRFRSAYARIPPSLIELRRPEVA